MATANLNSVTISYQDSGDGEPIVLIHGSLIADSFAPILAEPSLERFRLITYRRRGYKDSTAGQAPHTMSLQAADLVGLLKHLGIQRAHLVGHSYGGVVALCVALEVPEVVQTLTLLEPALMLGESGAAYRESFVHIQDEFATGNYAEIVDGMLRPRFGPDYRGYLDQALPGAFDDAVAGGLGTTVAIDIPPCWIGTSPAKWPPESTHRPWSCLAKIATPSGRASVRPTRRSWPGCRMRKAMSSRRPPTHSTSKTLTTWQRRWLSSSLATTSMFSAQVPERFL